MKFNLLKGGKKNKAAKTAETGENFDPEVTQTGVENNKQSKSLFARFFSKKKVAVADNDEEGEGTGGTAPKQSKSLFGSLFAKKGSTKNKKGREVEAESARNQTESVQSKPSKNSFKPKRIQGMHPLVQLLVLIAPWLLFMAFSPDLVKREKNLMVVLDKDLEKVEHTLDSLLEKERQIQTYKDQQKLGQSKVGLLKTIKTEKSLVAQALDRLPGLATDTLWFSGSEFQKTIDGNWFYMEGYTDQDPKVAELMFAVKGVDFFDSVELVFTKRVPMGNTDVVNFKIKARFKTDAQVAATEAISDSEPEEEGKK